MVMWRDLPGLFACDVSKDDGHPALVVFIGGPLALRWRGLGDAGLRAEADGEAGRGSWPGSGGIHSISLSRLDR